MTVRQLKLQDRFMSMKIQGLKKWELRVDDRGYKVGDFVHYKESAREPNALAFG